MHGGKSTGAPQGNRNAYKHGRYTAEAIANRVSVMRLLNECKKFINASNESLM